MKRQQLVAAIAALFLSGLLIGCGGGAEPAEPPAAQTAAVQTLAAEIAANIEASSTKPPPVVAANTAEPTAEGGDQPVMPTALPTAIPTEAPPTEVPTETPPPTAVPPTAAPIVVQPPAPPPAAPPTATPVPPTAAPQVGANGLVAANFAIQSRAELFVGGDIWFEFTVTNSTGNPVPFDALGVMPKKDGVNRPEWYQHSWGGNNDVIPVGGLSWDDHINLPEAGNYTLRLVICFDGPACQAQRGTWHNLSGEIPITVVQR